MSEKEGKQIHLNPIDEEQLEDHRNEITENIFIEVDIAKKIYATKFGDDDFHFYQLSLLHTTVAFLISNLPEEHNLGNINLENFKIPNSQFKNNQDETIDDINKLTFEQGLHYVTNLLINSKDGFEELLTSGYFDDLRQEHFMIRIDSFIYQIRDMYDKSILAMNNKYSSKNFKL